MSRNKFKPRKYQIPFFNSLMKHMRLKHRAYIRYGTDKAIAEMLDHGGYTSEDDCFKSREK